MTKEELLQFIETTGLIGSLPPETMPGRLIEAIRNAEEGALPEVEKTVKDLYVRQKQFQEEMRELERQIAALLRRAKKLKTKYAEAEEENYEEKKSEQLIKEL